MTMAVLSAILRMMWLPMWMRVLMHYFSVSMNMHVNDDFPGSVTALAILGTDLADAFAFRALIEFCVHG